MKEATELIRQKLMESIFEVFEKMLFVFLEPSEQAGSHFELGAAIQFHDNQMKGDCRIWLSRELGAVIARNLLDLNDKEISAKCATDCVTESVNMICGNFLAKFDSTRVFNLSIPVAISDKPEQVVERDGLYRLDFDSDHGKIAVAVTIPAQ